MRRFIWMIGATLLMIIVLVGAFALLSPSSVEASSAYPVVNTFTQPDGTEIELRLWGDEFANGQETLDGYTVIKNQTTGYWEYAVLDSSGNLVPSGVIVDRGTPPASPGLRPSLEAINTARAAMGAPPAGTPTLNSPPAWAGPDTDVLFIMVEFTDVACSFTDAQMQTNLFGGGATGPGDLDDYFREISYGQLEVDGRVEGGGGCYALANTHTHYDQGPGTAKDVVIEAVNAADADVDFSIYDNDGNGYVDVVGIIYAGGGPHDGCETDDDGPGGAGDNLWPHSSGLGGSAVTVDGVTVDRYIIQSEITWAVADGVCDEMQTIGLFAHEFGHSLGLPDLYDTDGSSSGVGSWSAMASQFLSTVNLADTPEHYDPWSKSYLGWITPTDYTGFVGNGPIQQVETNPFVIQLLANPGGVEGGKTPGTGEYFLVENRQQVNFDSQLPGCGLLIWHIEESQATNKYEGHTTALHRLVDLEEADGQDDLDRDPTTDPQANRGDAGDPYPGTSFNRLFNDVSYPTANLYDGSPSGVRIADISDCGAVMLANFGNPDADVEIVKIDDPDPVVAGEQISYRIIVTNNGPGSATNVEVTDVLPAGVTYVTDTDTCVEGPAGTLTCSLGDMLSGETMSFTILVDVDSDLVASAGGPTSIMNTATVTADQWDSDLTNNESSAATIVLDEADLNVVKDCKPDGTVLAGEEATCTILVDNLGPSTARNAVLTDTYLSDGTFTFGTITTDTGSCGVASNVVTCDLGDLASGARATVTVPVSANEAQDINDHASVSSDTPDPNASNNQAEDGVSVQAVANLEICKFDAPGQTGCTGSASALAGPDPVIAGNTVRYEILVTNTGPSTAVNVVVEDVLPAEVSIVSVTSSSGTCNAGVPGDPFLPTTCTFDTVPYGGTRTMVIVVKVNPDTLATLIHNDARAFSDTFDPDNSDNLATTDTTVNTQADLQITKMDFPDPVVAGEQMTYQVEITNNGPSTARNVSLTDTLPDEVSFVGCSISDGGTCELLEVPPFTVECQLNDLDPGESVLVFIDVLVDPSVPDGTTISNTATAASTTADPNAGNNSATEGTTVNAEADLTIVKDVNFETGSSSTTIIYYITATNLGPSDAQNVTVVDTLPSVTKGKDSEKVEFVFATEGCVYDETTHTVTCDIGTMAAGDSADLQIHIQVNGNAGVITNTVEVTSTTDDPDTSNNIDTKDVTVQGGSDRPGGPGGGRGKGPKSK